MWIIAAAIIGFVMDCFLGDPAWMPHPIRLIGLCISRFERLFRRIFPQTPRGAYCAGIAMAVAVLLVTGTLTIGVLILSKRINRYFGFAVACVMCWQVQAAKCLRNEALKVQRLLEENDLPNARQQVGMLVGRDTDALSSSQVAKAAIETVAENTCDGVIAPLFWLIIGGPVGAMLYKAVNTMDSMVGYKNERYLYFGRFAARLDDFANYLPARLSAVFMITAAFVLGFDGSSAGKIWHRDRRKHASPNSAQTEAACAGALNIQLAGDASYFGKVCKKPFIGDPVRPVEARDIERSCRLMYGAGILALVIFVLFRMAFVLL